MEPALGKHARVQSLLQFYQIWADTPYLQHYEFMKAIMEMFDFYNTDKYLKTPQQVQQEQQAAMAQQQKVQMDMMAMEEAQARNADERKMTNDIMKGLMK
jgi:hypothetical protein